jgi:hypothetical protein
MALPVLPPRFRSVDEGLRQLAAAVRALADGRSNAVGTVTLAVGATSTAVSDARVGAGSTILLTPTSASAVSADTAVWLAAVADGGFTLAHDANAAADRTFRYAIQG